MPPLINGGVNSRAPRPSGGGPLLGSPLGTLSRVRVPSPHSSQHHIPSQFLIRQRKKNKQTGKLSSLLFLRVGVPGGIYKYLKFSPAV